MFFTFSLFFFLENDLWWNEKSDDNVSVSWQLSLCRIQNRTFFYELYTSETVFFTAIVSFNERPQP